MLLGEKVKVTVYTYTLCIDFSGMFQTVRFIQMMSLTFGLFTQVSDSWPLGPLVSSFFFLSRFLVKDISTTV